MHRPAAAAAADGRSRVLRALHSKRSTRTRVMHLLQHAMQLACHASMQYTRLIETHMACTLAVLANFKQQQLHPHNCLYRIR
jgi:hypothetical protein